MFDVVVIGGGPAGLSAALMLGRCRRRVLVCDLGQPRNRHSRAIHGYLTRDGIAPHTFAEMGRGELSPYGVEVRGVGVTGARRADNRFAVALGDGGEEQTKFLLIATGVIDDLPAIEGFNDCYGRSVFHCPYCDGWEWRDRRLAAIGCGLEATGLALALRTWSKHVVLITHGERCQSQARARLERNGIAVRGESVARVEHVDGLVRAVHFASGDPVAVDAMFFSSRQHPQSDLAVRLGCALTSRGTVKTGNTCETNVPGVFVAGDASRDAQFVAVATSEGMKAAVAINRALQGAELR
jgi:thioredoxin reductase